MCVCVRVCVYFLFFKNVFVKEIKVFIKRIKKNMYHYFMCLLNYVELSMFD